MSGFVTTIDARALFEKAHEIERKHFPFAIAQTLIDAGFVVRSGWKDEMPRVFQNPTAWTLNAVLLRAPGHSNASISAVKAAGAIEVFLRNELGDGIPPAYYLTFQVRGGARRAKRSESLLRSAGVMAADEFIVPARGLQLDQYGNIPAKTFTAVLSDVQALNDEQDRSTVESRRRRARRNRKRAGSGVYFANRKPRGKLPRGIYERLSGGFVGPRQGGAQGSLRGVLMFVKQPHYESIYNVFDIANRLFASTFANRFQDNLNAAVAGIRRVRS